MIPQGVYNSGQRMDVSSGGDLLLHLQSFYYEGKPIMSNEEFDNLKEELMWEGSKVVMLSKRPMHFLHLCLLVSFRDVSSEYRYGDCIPLEVQVFKC